MTPVQPYHYHPALASVYKHQAQVTYLCLQLQCTCTSCSIFCEPACGKDEFRRHQQHVLNLLPVYTSIMRKSHISVCSCNVHAQAAASFVSLHVGKMNSGGISNMS